MKRLILAAPALSLAVCLAPITPASAEKAEGRCVINGKAVFSPGNLRSIPTPKLGYEFHGTAACETLPAREVRTGKVDVNGEETLSCAGSLGEAEGKGTLTMGGLELPFGVTFFSGTPGSTALAVKFADGGVAIGAATFLTSRDEEPSQCFMLEGASHLQFKAAAVGEL
jgi:hypothetical protein